MSSCWGPTSMGFTRFRVKACGLKTPDRQTEQRYKGHGQGHRTEPNWENNPVNTEFAPVYFPYAYTP